jgi:hypothetical protein
MSNVMPVLLWYGGLLGILAGILFVLWALGLYALKHATGSFVAVLLIAAVVLASGSTWAVTRATRLKQGDQLSRVHEPLIRLVATSVNARAALEDLRAVAEPSPELTALQSKYDAHEAAIENLLQAEWQYQRGDPWDERSLLYKTTWDLNDVRVHHARWERRAEALECPATSAAPVLADVTARVQDRLQNERTLAAAIGETFEGYDLNAPQAQPWSNARTMRVLAVVFGGLVLLTVFFVWRKRSWQMIDLLVALVAIALVNLAGWLALGAGADQERLRSTLFDRTSTVFRETLDLNESLKALMPLPRGGVLSRDSSEKLIADYAGYMNSVNNLTLLVRIWDRAVLTDVLDAALISAQRIQTHDDLLNAIRAGMLSVYRQYVQLDRRLAELSCRSEWFPREGGRTREDELLALPAM